jgi:pSer/pThr/pTyr-binding forkhead associated (FHA) protein
VASHSAIAGLRDACGAAGALRILVKQARDRKSEVLVSKYPFGVVGRLFEADFSLSDPQVSKRHAYLQIVSGRVLCVDIGSRNGLVRKGKAVGWTWLDRETPVGVGDLEIRLPDDSQEAGRYDEFGRKAPNPFTARQRANLPDTALEILYPGNRLSYWPMRSEVALLGRASECKIQLIDETVSRFHCSLLRTPTGLWVVDLVAERGIVVNGARVRYSRLDVDDELVVGGFRIRPVAVNPSISSAFPAIPASRPGGTPIAFPRTLQGSAVPLHSNQRPGAENLI